MRAINLATAVNADSNLENLKAIHNHAVSHVFRHRAVNADSNLENLKAIHNVTAVIRRMAVAVNADSNLENLKAIHNCQLAGSIREHPYE